MKNQTLALLLAASFSFFGCEQPEESNPIAKNRQNYDVTMKVSSYSVADLSPIEFIIPKAYAGITDLKFCFKRLRFKKETEIEDPNIEDNIDIELGEVSIASEGLVLGTVSVPADTYSRIEFDLEPDCDGQTKNSVTLTNDLGDGNHSTRDRITIKFEGPFVISSNEELSLNVQTIVDAANGYDGLSAEELKDVFEAVSGDVL